jgi:hypothetical protein
MPVIWKTEMDEQEYRDWKAKVTKQTRDLEAALVVLDEMAHTTGIVKSETERVNVHLALDHVSKAAERLARGQS